MLNFVPVVILSVVINDNIKSLANIKKRFKRRISWSKYRFETTTQTKNYNLDYLIYSIFRNINRLFVLSFKNGNDDVTGNYFDKYYMSSVEIKDFNVLSNNKSFFDPSVKNKQEAYEKLLEMWRNDDYTTTNSLDYLYHQKIL